MSFLRRKRFTSDADLTGKTVIVTGANTGIGYWAARDFALRQAKVILACRSKERAEAAREKIVSETGNNNVVVRLLDLFDFSSVRQFAEQIHKEEERLDILVNNAGLAGADQQPSEHGLEITMATNHFGPFLLTLLLIDLLKKSSQGRIVIVSSVAHSYHKQAIEFDKMCYQKEKGTLANYAWSKLANVLFTKELARRLQGTGVTANCLHPGAVDTEIWRNVPTALRFLLAPIKLFFKTSEQGAETTIYLAVSEEVEGHSGLYYEDCKLAENKLGALAKDAELAKKMWDFSVKVTGFSGDIL